MAYTQLSPIALPGRRYSFTAKAASGSAKGAGTFTALSVIALPGGRHSFTGKAPAGSAKGSGTFTALSVLALPGMRQAFVGKAIAAPPVVIPVPWGVKKTHRFRPRYRGAK